MVGKSNIEWTDATWNPIVGCSILSPGCTNCYAMKMAARIEAMKSSHYDGTTKRVNGNAVWTGKLALAPDHILLEPLRRKKPTTYFVNSMGDLFHEDVPDEWIDKVFAVMALSPQHTFQVLTKRVERMREYMTRPLTGPWAGRAFRDGAPSTDVDFRMRSRVLDLMRLAPGLALNRACKFMDDRDGGEGDGFYRHWPLPNVWLGVSAERQQEADERIPLLLQTPAAVRFISAEPLLGDIYLRGILIKEKGRGLDSEASYPMTLDALTGLVRERWNNNPDDPKHGGDFAALDWVIVGGESGPRSRPMHPDWARSIRDQCAAAGVAFFFKQWGEWASGCTHLGTGEVVFRQFTSFQQWVDKASTWVNGGVCLDRHGVELKRGADFARTRDEESFPVTIMHRVGKARAGRLLDSIEHNAMPSNVRGA